MKPASIDFVIVGAAKSATTWLRHQLQDDPAIYMPDPELHFFSREYDRGMSWYLDQFTPHDGARLIGEKSNSYLDTEGAAARLHAALPRARLIAVLRDPVERAYSDYCMYFRRGAVSGDIWKHLDPARAGNERFLSISRYDLHLERLLSFYPQDALHVIQYERVSSDPQGTLDSVRAHLGLPPRAVAPASTRRVNDSRAKLLPLRLRRALKPLKPMLAPLRGTGPFEAIRGVLASEVQYPRLEPDLRERMIEYLAPVYVRLTEMGYPLGDSSDDLTLGDSLPTPKRKEHNHRLLP